MAEPSRLLKSILPKPPHFPRGGRANADYGAAGPSADTADNVEKTYGETKEKQSGVKGLMNKITEKMNLGHEKQTQQQRVSVLLRFVQSVYLHSLC